MRKIQRQIFESKNEFTICTFFGQGCDERTTGKRFFSEIFSDVPYKWPLEAYGTRGSLRDAWRPAYGMHGSLRELANESHHCTMHAPKTTEMFVLE